MSIEIRNPIGPYSKGVRFVDSPLNERAEAYAAHVTEIRKRADELAYAKDQLQRAKSAVWSAERTVDRAQDAYAQARAAFDEFMPPVTARAESVAVVDEGEVPS